MVTVIIIMMIVEVIVLIIIKVMELDLRIMDEEHN